MAQGRSVIDPETGKRRCTADKTHQPGVRCGKAPRVGAVVCETHGGNAPQVLASSARKLHKAELETRAKNIVKRAGHEPVEDPVEELAKVAGEVIAFKDAVAQLIDLTEARYEHQAGEQLRAEVALYERALDRSAKTLESIIKLDLSGRRTKVEEAKIMIVMAAINAAFTRLELPASQKAKVIQVFQEELNAASAAQA